MNKKSQTINLFHFNKRISTKINYEDSTYNGVKNNIIAILLLYKYTFLLANNIFRKSSII